MINSKMSVAVFLLILVLHLYRVGTSVFRDVLSVYLLVFLHVGFVCVFACLSYFFQCLFALFYCFFLGKLH